MADFQDPSLSNVTLQSLLSTLKTRYQAAGNIANNQFLREWLATLLGGVEDVAEGTGFALDNLNDVDTTGLITGGLLVKEAGGWVDSGVTTLIGGLLTIGSIQINTALTLNYTPADAVAGGTILLRHTDGVIRHLAIGSGLSINGTDLEGAGTYVLPDPLTLTGLTVSAAGAEVVVETTSTAFSSVILQRSGVGKVWRLGRDGSGGTISLQKQGGDPPFTTGDYTAFSSDGVWLTLDNVQVDTKLQINTILDINYAPPDATAGGLILFQHTDGELRKLAIGSGLSINGTDLEAPGGSTHEMLSASHTDSLAGTVVRGDLIVGNATPKWARLPKGNNGQFLVMSGINDPAWAALVIQNDTTPALGGSLQCNGYSLGNTGDIIISTAAAIMNEAASEINPIFIPYLSELGTGIGGGAGKVSVIVSDANIFTATASLITLADSVNFAFNTTTGSTIGTAATQKLSLWGVTPIVQPAGTGETTGYAAVGGTNVNSSDTFTGNIGTKAYTINDVVKALKNAGIMAAS